MSADTKNGVWVVAPVAVMLLGCLAIGVWNEYVGLAVLAFGLGMTVQAALHEAVCPNTAQAEGLKGWIKRRQAWEHPEEA